LIGILPGIFQEHLPIATVKNFWLIAVITVVVILATAGTTQADQVLYGEAKSLANGVGVYSVSPWTSLVTVLALLLYFAVTANVGRARAKYKIAAPQMSGEPNFERVLRVQQNTLEQLILFVPALWLFSWFVSPVWGAGIGAIWVIGRILYALGYYQVAEKRALGFGISLLTTLVLLLGSLVGAIMALLKTAL
jgi:uncharacterized membrane protein YecN with MAPEG domain